MLTFREEWYDDRLRFDGLNGKSNFILTYIVFMEFLFFPSYWEALVKKKK